MDSSNNPDLAAETATTETASPVETTHETTPAHEPHEKPAEAPAEVKPPEKELSLKDKILSRKTETPAAAPIADKTPPVKPGIVNPGQAASDATPKYEANFKYKAFGKEKELPESFRSLVKDPESEKQVKEVFTRAEAFDDMKNRYEQSSMEHQKVLQQHVALDRDVRKLTGFLNKGDLDNFFAGVRVTDEMLLQHLQRKAEIAKLSPMQQQAYSEAQTMRQQNYEYQEQMSQMQANNANQAVLNRTMQLDMTLNQPSVSSIANSWDSKMGHGAFRQLVAEEAARHWHTTKQDLSAHDATQMVIQKFGRLLDSPAPQAPVIPAAQQQVPQAPQPVVGAKPVIPNVQGRGGSPIKQSPKSLDELRKMGKAARMAEANPDLE